MNDISLTSGFLPIVVAVVGVAALLFLLVPRRGRSWWPVPVAGVLVACACYLGLNWFLTRVVQELPEDLPAPVVAWTSIGVGAVVLVIGQLIGSGWRRQLLSILCGVLVLVTVASRINIYFDEYDTVGDLTGASTAGVVDFSDTASGKSESMPTPVVDRWKGPATGASAVATATIPGVVSGFTGRAAYIYTPPAYNSPGAPLLPVLILVSGQPGDSADWVESGRLQVNMDAFAAAHDGLAPVTVVVDPNGSEDGNTMCMDSTIAKADTYLTEDVVDWITTNLAVDSNHAHWAFGGWSFGGTCALQMATRHPDLFPSFFDFQGEEEPATSPDRSVTIAQAFGGDTAAFDALVPMTLLRTQRYPDTWAFFAVGGQDSVFQAYQQAVVPAAKAAGMTVQAVDMPDQGHSWAVPIAQTVPALEFLGARMGLRH